jgi:hypothetical protein
MKSKSHRSFVFINIPGLFRKKAIGSQLSAVRLRLSALRLTPRHFDLVICFHQHSRFVPQESYQLSAISRQPLAVGFTSDSSTF